MVKRSFLLQDNRLVLMHSNYIDLSVQLIYTELGPFVYHTMEPFSWRFFVYFGPCGELLFLFQYQNNKDS